MTTKPTKTKAIQAATKAAMTPKDGAKDTPPAKLDDKQRAQAMAAISLSPTHTAAGIVTTFTGNLYGETEPFAVADELARQCERLQRGDLRRVEFMLLSQAHALDVMFASLARRGKNQDQLPQYEAHMKLALRAQSQCRATLEALAAIKNPPVVFAKQANIAHGPQQVNNDSQAIARAEQIENQPTELLEHDHGQRLDTGTKAAASGSNQAMETMEAVHRPAHSSRQGARKP